MTKQNICTLSNKTIGFYNLSFFYKVSSIFLHHTTNEIKNPSNFCYPGFKNFTNVVLLILRLKILQLLTSAIIYQATITNTKRIQEKHPLISPGVNIAIIKLKRKPKHPINNFFLKITRF